MKRIPAAAGIRSLLLGRGDVSPPKSKGDLLKRLGALYALPIQKAKVKKAVDTELTVLHDGIRRFVAGRRDLFQGVEEILLENQPVLKNPTMKSVQILLFATLRDLLQPNPPRLRLVHAKKKVEVETTGDAGYKDRKQGSEKRVETSLQSGSIREGQRWRNFLASHTKKNDLTDAYCMCLDALSP